jgi:hypothetical protein
MHRNITPLQVTRSSRVSNRASGGFTTIVPSNSSTARSCTLLTRIHWINRCPGRPKRCLRTGKRSFTNSPRLFGFRSCHHPCGRRLLRPWRENRRVSIRPDDFAKPLAQYASLFRLACQSMFRSRQITLLDASLPGLTRQSMLHTRLHTAAAILFIAIESAWMRGSSPRTTNECASIHTEHMLEMPAPDGAYGNAP